MPGQDNGCSSAAWGRRAAILSLTRGFIRTSVLCRSPVYPVRGGPVATILSLSRRCYGGLQLPDGCFQLRGRDGFFLFLAAVFAHGAQFGFAGGLNKTGRMYHVLQLMADKRGAQFGDFAATRADNQ